MFETDPFVSIDQAGVGKLMKLAVDAARQTNPKINIGICGEHGGDPASVEFCHALGLDNVSCSPYRVPVARLAAAQAAIKEKNFNKTAANFGALKGIGKFENKDELKRHD